MLTNTLIKKYDKYSLYYNLKHKLNKKYKKIIKYNNYYKVYNPRQEINKSFKTIINKNKFYIN